MSGRRQRKMFISVLPGEQIEVVLTRDGHLQEYYVEMLQQTKTKRNIYKGTIHNVDTALQAAFVFYGAERNGFLQIDEVHPEYFIADVKPEKGQKHPPIQKVLRPGQELLVQVVKEPTGNKGAFLTTYLTLPGRYFVLTPGKDNLALSRKIEDEKERARLREIVKDFKLEPGIGGILRTESFGQNKTNLSKDLQFLKRLWKEVRKKGVFQKGPGLIYEEKDLAFRAVRDYLTSDVSEIWVDHLDTARQIQEFASLVFPRRKKIVKKHLDTNKTLFERFNLQRQLDELYGRKVTLPSGGGLVFDQTEALTAVDINSGKIGGEQNFKEMALKTNLEAAQEIAKQLRLRDIGGQVVIDFIEMKEHKNCREVEKRLQTALKEDKARTTVGKISRFGLLELVRQRMGSSAMSTTLVNCSCCDGAGLVRTKEWRALQALKDIYMMLRSKKAPNPLEYKIDSEMVQYILNYKRNKLLEFEKKFQTEILITSE